jgi:hypothetical protein
MQHAMGKGKKKGSKKQKQRAIPQREKVRRSEIKHSSQQLRLLS